jgi:hypothetical protein
MLDVPEMKGHSTPPPDTTEALCLIAGTESCQATAGSGHARRDKVTVALLRSCNGHQYSSWWRYHTSSGRYAEPMATTYTVCDDG